MQGLADADEAAVVFFDGVDEVEAFGYQFVAQAGSVVVRLDVGHAEAAVEGAGAEDADLVVENLNLDVAGVGVAAVHYGFEQSFAQGGQGLGEALNFCLREVVGLEIVRFVGVP